MNEFNPQSKSTIGVEFAFKTIEIRGDEIKGMLSTEMMVRRLSSYSRLIPNLA